MRTECESSEWFVGWDMAAEELMMDKHYMKVKLSVSDGNIYTGYTGL